MKQVIKQEILQKIDKAQTKLQELKVSIGSDNSISLILSLNHEIWIVIPAQAGIQTI